MELSFSCIIYNYYSETNGTEILKNILSNCLVDVTSFSILPKTIPQNEFALYEKIEKVEVTLKLLEEHFPRHAHKCNAYRFFIKRWCSQAQSTRDELPPKLPNLLILPKRREMPWLMMHNNDSFLYTKKVAHEKVTLTKFQMGTFVNSSLFFIHVNYDFVMPRNGNYDKYFVNFYHDTRQFELHIYKNKKSYSMSFKYNNLRQIMVEVKNKKVQIYLSLINPPALFVYENDYSTAEKKPKKKRVRQFHDVTSDEIGRCNTIALEMLSDESAWEIISRLYFRCGKQPIAIVVIDSTYVNFPSQVPHIDLGHFGCTYILNAILRRNFVLQLQNLGLNFQEMLSLFGEIAKYDPENLYEALVEALRVLDVGYFLAFRNEICTLAFKLKDKKNEAQDTEKYLIPPKTKRICQLVITPTRLVFFPSEINFENRIIRKYDADYALRVSFRDDDYGKLSYRSNTMDDNFVKEVLSDPVLKGITVGPKRFEFLGWSNSQLRDHGVFMYAEDKNGNTAESIRSWMGNFTEIKSVPKFMARMGQCFSHSEATVTVPLDSSRIITIPDIIGGCNPVNSLPYVFSDGVGMISETLLKEVTEVLGFDHIPSAIQFRYAGYKGMLVLNPHLEDVDIVFRESQKKFVCEASNCLEVVNKSKPVDVLLNRFIITILDQKKIPIGVFLEMQHEMLKSLTKMLFDENLAAEYLTSHSALPKLKYKELAAVGIFPNSEIFFRNMLLAEHRVAIEGLRMKTRLAINPSQGRNMYGVIDEFGVLEYGEVFVQYSVDIEAFPRDQTTKVLLGDVLVTKNPCLSLGDVRMFKAVDVSELHHIKDCLVFPQKGPRPHPNEMAGSDLDGDEYTVIWKKDLFFKENSPANDFPIAEQKIHYGPITIHDMLDFLAYFIVNDQIGVISNAHLVKADELIDGLKSDMCHKLAMKHSIAVDFAKNGQQVALDKDEKPVKYPDFMEKGGHSSSYQSKKAVGKLYRVVKDYKDENKIAMENSNSREIDDYLIFPGWQEYEEFAEKSCSRYTKVFGFLLNTYGIPNEFDACAKACSKMHVRAGRNEQLNVEEILTISIRHIWKTFEEEFYTEFGGVACDIGEVGTQVMKKASAWYIVAYRNPERFLSFPWICWKVLVNIRMLNINNNKLELTPLSNPYIHKLHKNVMIALNQSDLKQLGNDLQEVCDDIYSKDKQKILTKFYLDIALAILVHWANSNDLIQNDTPDVCLKISTSYLGGIFSASVANGKWSCSPTVMELILNFFHYCSSFTYQSRANIREPIRLFRCRKVLGRKAMSTYHSLAVGSNLKCLNLLSAVPSRELDEEEMEPIMISKTLLEASFPRDAYKTFKEKLISYSGAIEVNVREQRDLCLVSAAGSLSSLSFIRKFLLKMSSN